MVSQIEQERGLKSKVGLAIEPLRESMEKLSYGEAVETFLLNIYSLNNLKFSSQE